LTEKLASN